MIRDSVREFCEAEIEPIARETEDDRILGDGWDQVKKTLDAKLMEIGEGTSEI